RSAVPSALAWRAAFDQLRVPDGAGKRVLARAVARESRFSSVSGSTVGNTSTDLPVGESALCRACQPGLNPRQIGRNEAVCVCTPGCCVAGCRLESIVGFWRALPDRRVPGWPRAGQAVASAPGAAQPTDDTETGVTALTPPVTGRV